MSRRRAARDLGASTRTLDERAGATLVGRFLGAVLPFWLTVVGVGAVALGVINLADGYSAQTPAAFGMGGASLCLAGLFWWDFVRRRRSRR